MVDPKVRKLRRKRLAWTVVTVLALALVAGGVAGFLWWRSLETKIHPVSNMDPEFVKLLGGTEPPPPGEPFFMVLMGSDTRPGEPQQRSDTLIVARVDPKKKHIQMLSIPRDSRVDVPGAGMTKINAAAFYGGPKLTVKTVKQFTGLPIRYYVNIGFIGFKDVVNAIGGVWINVPVAINDRDASGWGSRYSKIKKGYQKLDGRHALTFVRARHQFPDQDITRTKHQQMFIKALARQALQLSNIFNAPAIINAVASHLQTNMSTSKMAELVLQFRGMDDDSIESVTMPGYNSFQDGQSFIEPDDQKLEAIIDKMKRGAPIEPGKAKKAAAKFKPKQVPITIRNGAGVSGVAKQASDFLSLKGFPIKETGNMQQFVYGKTLIVYGKDKDARDKANLVRGYLGFGDVVASAGMYKFNTPVMLVIGKDWKNPEKTSGRP